MEEGHQRWQRARVGALAERHVTENLVEATTLFEGLYRLPLLLSLRTTRTTARLRHVSERTLVDVTRARDFAEV